MDKTDPLEDLRVQGRVVGMTIVRQMHDECRAIDEHIEVIAAALKDVDYLNGAPDNIGRLQDAVKGLHELEQEIAKVRVLLTEAKT